MEYAGYRFKISYLNVQRTLPWQPNFDLLYKIGLNGHNFTSIGDIEKILASMVGFSGLSRGFQICYLNFHGRLPW